MSDVDLTPIKGTPPVSGKKSLSQDKSGNPQNPDKQAQTQDKEAIEKPNFDSAVAVAPSVMGLHLHQHVEGDIETIDPEGRPVMVTSHAKFALEPNAGLTPGHHIEIEITQLNKTIEGTLKMRDGQSVPLPIQVTLTLVNLLHQPDVTQEQLASATDLQYTYKEGQKINPQVAADKAFKGDQASIAMQKAITAPITNIPKDGSLPPQDKPVNEPPKLLNPTTSTLSPSDMKSLVTETQNISAEGKSASVHNPATTAPVRETPLGQGNFFPARMISSAANSLESSTPKDVFEAIKTLGIGAPLTATIVPTLEISEKATIDVAKGDVAKGDVARGDVAKGVPAPTIQIGNKGEPLLNGVFITADQSSGRKTLESPSNLSPQSNQTLQTIDTHYLKTEAGVVMITAPGGITVGTPLSIALTPTSTASPEGPDNNPRPLSQDEAKMEQVKIATEMQNQRAAAYIAKSIIENEAAPYAKPLVGNPTVESASPSASTTPSQTAAAPTSTAATPPVQTPTETPNQSAEVKPDLPQENALFKAMGAQKPLTDITPAPLRDMPQNWPVMEALQQTLAAATLAGTANVGADPSVQLMGRTPGANQSFANTALFFMAALGVKDPKVWLGKTLSKTIETAQKKNIFKALFQDFSRLSQLKSAPLQGEWRPTLIPFQTDQQIQAMVILSREEQNQQQGEGKADKENEGDSSPGHKRFLIAVDLSHLGKVELDGLLRPLKLDFVLRTEKNIPPAIAQDMQDSFESAMARSELTGSLSFEPLEKSPVDISAILNEAQAVIADQELKI